MDKRQADVQAIEKAYSEVEAALSNVGKLLRTTEAGKFMWASDHKSAVTGLRIVVEKLRGNVPSYGRK
jgi:hypothetical protein